MDRMGANFAAVVEAIRTKLRSNAVPIVLPMGEAEGFAGNIDLVSMESVVYSEEDQGATLRRGPIPEAFAEAACAGRMALIEALADVDEAVAEAYLSAGDVSVELMRKALRAATVSSKVLPVLCGTALKNKGIQLLLDAVVYYLPSPLDRPAVRGEAVGKGNHPGTSCHPSAGGEFIPCLFGQAVKGSERV
jgi:elongation factor G